MCSTVKRTLSIKIVVLTVVLKLVLTLVLKVVFTVVLKLVLTVVLKVVPTVLKVLLTVQALSNL